jgi:uncharacterized protein (DUF4415 family)
MPALLGGPTVEAVDDRFNYGETRTNCLGEIEGRSLSSPSPGAAQTVGSSARGKPMRENEKHIARVTRDEARSLKGETDYVRLDAMTDNDIAKAVGDEPDAAPLDIDWTKASLVLPPGKDVITLRLDRDVLNWLRAQGKGYQTLINQVLRAWYDAQIGRARREKVAVGQKAAEKNAAKKAAAKRSAKKAAAKHAAPAKKRA